MINLRKLGKFLNAVIIYPYIKEEGYRTVKKFEKIKSALELFPQDENKFLLSPEQAVHLNTKLNEMGHSSLMTESSPQKFRLIELVGRMVHEQDFKARVPHSILSGPRAEIEERIVAKISPDRGIRVALIGAEDKDFGANVRNAIRSDIDLLVVGVFSENKICLELGMLQTAAEMGCTVFIINED